MPSPATMPDDIKATPDHHRRTPSARLGQAGQATQHNTRRATQPLNTAPPSPTRTHQTASSTSTAAPHPTSHRSAAPNPQSSGSPQLTEASTSTRTRSTARRSWPSVAQWLHYAAVNRERGMSTAEYAVGTIAACAFAALLFKVVSSSEVQEMLTSLINRALNTAKE
ncbi:DUF4244 domain-containing protein [Nonomuraea sp. N2-4H]|uniref:DUF4244 domain-containing protein n=2 Tax=Streptosporangiaceae TaxID=2004 RepID=UPI00324C217F